VCGENLPSEIPGIKLVKTIGKNLIVFNQPIQTNFHGDGREKLAILFCLHRPEKARAARETKEQENTL
jgi:hypothetical protein